MSNRFGKNNGFIFRVKSWIKNDKSNQTDLKKHSHSTLKTNVIELALPIFLKIALISILILNKRSTITLKIYKMENEKTTYIFRFRGFEPKFVQRRGESYIDYEMMYFNEQKEFTEDEFNTFLAECQKTEHKRKLIDWIKA